MARIRRVALNPVRGGCSQGEDPAAQADSESGEYDEPRRSHTSERNRGCCDRALARRHARTGACPREDIAELRRDRSHAETRAGAGCGQATQAADRRLIPSLATIAR